MSRIRRHIVMRVLAVPIAALIGSAHALLILIAFPIMSMIELLPARVTARQVASEFGLLAASLALTVCCWALTVFVLA